MTQRDRNKALLLLGVAILLAVVLASGLGGLQLQPGRPFSLREAAPGGVGLGGVFSSGEIIVLVMRGVLALVLVLLPVYILVHLLTPEGRKRLVGDLVLLLIVLLGANLLSLMPQRTPDETDVPMPEAGPLFPEIPGEPTDVFSPQTPEWLLPVVAIALALLIAGLGTTLAWLYVRRKRREQEETPFDRLASSAQSALEAIQSGLDLKDTVMRCYFEMSQVLYEERNIERKTAMTPREFEQSLVRKGLPEEPVRRLTRLFEQVRYGSLRPGPEDEQQAVDSLTAIIAVLRSTWETGSR